MKHVPTDLTTDAVAAPGAQPSGYTRIVLGVVVALLVVVAAVRGTRFVLHQPLLAYANNYDQARYTACANVFPYRPDVLPAAASPDAPLELFSRRLEVREPCLWSTEVVHVWLAGEWLGWSERHGTIARSIRPLGVLAWGICLAILLAGVVSSWRWQQPALAAALAAVGAVVLVDPANLLWVNTFYAEFGSLTALLALVVLLTRLWVAPPSHGSAVLLVVAAIALAMGKLQFASLPLALAAAYALAACMASPSARGRRLRALAPLCCAALAGIAVQWHNVTRQSEPWLADWRRVTIFNAVVNGILGSSDDPAATARAIGLPAACAQHAGWNVFDFPNRSAAMAACPEALETSRATIFWRLLRKEPGTAVRLLVRAFGSVHPWVQRELGHVAGQRYGDVTQSWFSFGPLLERHPRIAASLLLAPVLYLVLACAMRRLRAEDVGLVLLGAWLGAATIWQQILITVVGDGVHDLSRQAFLAFDAALAFAVGLLTAALATAMARGVLAKPGRAR